jgi:hypothetical protein
MGYAQFWASANLGAVTTHGAVSAISSNNFHIFWNGNLWAQPMNSTATNGPITIYDASAGFNRIEFTAIGTASNNGTKRTPMLTADILGDWRENFVARTPDNNFIRIYTTIIPTDYRFVTFMHDPLYRTSITWQNSTYNQPPHISFYLADRDGHRNLQRPANISIPGGAPVFAVPAGGQSNFELFGDTILFRNADSTDLYAMENGGSIEALNLEFAQTSGIDFTAVTMETEEIDETAQDEATPTIPDITINTASDDEGGINPIIFIAGGGAIAVGAVVVIFFVKKK